MKKLNRILVTLLIVAFALPMLNSCTKKGDEDPGLSLKSRKSRLTNVWKLKEGTETGTWGGQSFTAMYNGSTVTYSMQGGSATTMYTQTIEFTKDNTFKTTVMDDGTMELAEGFWAFMGGYNEVSKEEIVVLRIKQYTSGNTMQMWTGDNMPTSVLRLKRLASSELIVETNGTSVSGNNTSVSSSLMTYIP